MNSDSPLRSHYTEPVVAGCAFGSFDEQGISKVIGDAHDALRELIPDIIG